MALDARQAAGEVAGDDHALLRRSGLGEQYDSPQHRRQALKCLVAAGLVLGVTPVLHLPHRGPGEVAFFMLSLITSTEPAEWSPPTTHPTRPRESGNAVGGIANEALLFH